MQVMSLFSKKVFMALVNNPFRDLALLAFCRIRYRPHRKIVFYLLTKDRRNCGYCNQGREQSDPHSHSVIRSKILKFSNFIVVFGNSFRRESFARYNVMFICNVIRQNLWISHNTISVACSLFKRLAQSWKRIVSSRSNERSKMF